ncbi:hypothetical protein HK096_007920 [Nowakowskiella sp. JEL0078]|nr:hypothetical protein HK096_007920 [Nowakowskiella sp. JEL0078]
MPKRILDCHSFLETCFRPRHINPFTMSAPTTPTVEIFGESQPEDFLAPTIFSAKSLKIKQVPSKNPLNINSALKIDIPPHHQDISEYEDDESSTGGTPTNSAGGFTPTSPNPEKNSTEYSDRRRSHHTKYKVKTPITDRVVVRARRPSVISNNSQNRRRSFDDKDLSNDSAMTKKSMSMDEPDFEKQNDLVSKIIAQVPPFQTFIIRRGVGSVSRRMIEKYRAAAQKERASRA